MRTIAAALLVQIALTSAAHAEGPAELSMSRGALVVDEQVLFVSDGSGDPCKAPCSATPFLASPESVPGGLWSVVQADEGAQWAYDGAPLYLWPQIGANYGERFFGYRQMMTEYYGLRPAMSKDLVGEGLAIPVDDTRVISQPFIERRTMAAYNLTNAASGTVIATACVDRAGNAGPVSITSPSGSASLDADALEFASIVQYQPARNAEGEAVAVCGVVVRFIWPQRPRGPVSVVLPER